MEQKPQRFYVHDLPVIRTPFTRLCETWGTSQMGPCAAFEMDYYRCAERVGQYRVEKDCGKLLDDFSECKYRIKSEARWKEMQNERKRQGKPFLPPPAKDSLRVDPHPD